MSHWDTRLDEEQQIIYLRETVVRRKNFLEQQRATYGMLNLPPHVQIEIEHLEEELRRLDQRLATARRRKRRQQTVQHVIQIAGGITRLGRPTHRANRRRKLSLMQRLRIAAVRLIVGALLIGGILSLGWWKSRTILAPALEAQLAPEPQQAIWSEVRVIANTGGIGVRFRHAPFQDAPSDAGLNDGTTVYLIERLVAADGEIWWKVQLTDGSTGYIKERYLAQP
jgi:hypothetical protein